MTQTGQLARARDWFERHPYLLPALIVLVGAIFRFYNLNWDNGHQLQPDERGIYELVAGAGGNQAIMWPGSIAQFFQVQDPTGGSPLNPHYFAYGSLPYYLVAFVAGGISLLGQHVSFLSSWATADTYANLPPIGRSLSGLLDLLSVFLIFLIGRRVFGYWTAVLAMTFAAFTVFEIQLSHFYQSDSLLLPLVLLTLLAAVKIADSDSRTPYIWGGIVLGAALATKTTALLLVVPLGAAAVLRPWTTVEFPASGSLVSRVRRHYAAIAPRLNRNLQWVLGAFIISALFFAIFEPYGILDRPLLLTDVAQQSSIIVSNNPPYGVPYTIQYAHDTAYVYQIQNILFWCMGIPLAVAAFAGVIYAAFRFFQARASAPQLVLLLWVIPYFLFVGTFFAKFDRYMLPILPVIALFGAALLVALVRAAHGRVRWLASAALIAVTAGSFLYSLAYMNIYAHTNTRVAASRWMFAHIPPGTTIAEEGAWDDPLPLDENGHIGGTTYNVIAMNLYDGETALADSDHKIGDISAALTRAQYLVMTSERMIGSIPKLPLQYPIVTRYYQLLFANKLNFRLVKVFQQHPQLGPFTVHDYPADESFHVYDHPIVRIFKRVAPISTAQVNHLLTTGLPVPPASADLSALPAILRPSRPPRDTRLMLSASKWHADQQGSTLDQMFPPGGFPMRHPILVWLLALELLGLIAFPFTFVLFRNLLDRGFVIAKTIGLVLLGYLVWMAVNFGIGTYERGLIGLALLILALLSAVMAYRRRVDLMLFLRSRWRYALAGELVFLAGFAAFILLRMWYPDLGHQYSPVSIGNVGGGRMGEKQMELAFLNAIVRSRVFPPFDPFFARGYINYYYYGFFLVGTLCKLTQIVPATGFNLAIATFFAMLAGNVFSVGLTLTRRIFPGVLAAVLVGAIGNLNGGWQVIQGLMSVATIHSAVPFFGGIVNVLSGLREVILDHQVLPAFDFWGPTRIVPGGAISEFPYFTYLFADLHPHLMAFPLTAAALAVAVNLVRGPYRGISARIVPVLLGGLLLGAIAATNPWDYPTYLLLIGLAALVGGYAIRRRLTLGVVARPILWLAGLAILSFLFYLPFKQSYQTVFSTGVGLVRNADPTTWGAAYCPDQTSNCPGYVHDVLVTPLSIFLEHFGLFLFIALSYVAVLLGASLGLLGRIQRSGTVARFAIYHRGRLPDLWRASRRARKMVPRHQPADTPALWGLLVLVLGLVAFQYYLLAFLAGSLGVIFAVLAALAKRLSPSRAFVLVLLGFALVLSILTQIFYVKDFLADSPSFRMNTIFKFYNQAWLLFAVAAACSLYYLMDTLVRQRRRGAGRSARERGKLQVGYGEHTVPPTMAFEALTRPHSPPSPLLAAASIHPSGSTAATSMETGARRGTRAKRGLAYARRVGGAGPRGLARPIAFLRRAPVWGTSLAILLFGSAIYTYAGTVSRETYRTSWLPENSVPFTLDGMAFMKVAYPGDYKAINWLNANVAGALVIAEAGPEYYDWRSRVSMFTGLPTIINGIHEGEQRFGDEIDPTALCGQTRDPSACLASTHSRSDDLTILYNSPSIAQAWRVIHTYDVRYIYVGFSEKQCVYDSTGAIIQCYSKQGLAKFHKMVGHGLKIAYRAGGVTIYQVTGA